MENGALAEKAEEKGFQMTPNASFSRKTERSEPGYRRMHVYSKSLGRYKKERERRRQVRLLAEAGFTQRQIAEKLGVSVRTVKRDWRKVERYVTGCWKKSIRQMSEEGRKALLPNLAPSLEAHAPKLDEMTAVRGLRARNRQLFRQIRLIEPVLKKELEVERRIRELPKGENRPIIFTVNLDKCDSAGIPGVEVLPRRVLVSSRDRVFWINFRVLKNGVKHTVAIMQLNVLNDEDARIDSILGRQDTA